MRPSFALALRLKIGKQYAVANGVPESRSRQHATPHYTCTHAGVAPPTPRAAGKETRPDAGAGIAVEAHRLHVERGRVGVLKHVAPTRDGGP